LPEKGVPGNFLSGFREVSLPGEMPHGKSPARTAEYWLGFIRGLEAYQCSRTGHGNGPAFRTRSSCTSPNIMKTPIALVGLAACGWWCGGAHAAKSTTANKPAEVPTPAATATNTGAPPSTHQWHY
jgi:hypothetical protein